MWLRCVSLIGLITFLGLAWLISSDRRRVPWRIIFWGLGLQGLLALVILKTPGGAFLFTLAQNGVLKLNEFANQGAMMVFGPLAESERLQSAFGPENVLIFAVFITATIIFISSLSALLYHWGVLQAVVRAMAWVMHRAMKTSGTETLAAAANVFVGQTEAPLVVRPYLPTMTRSELMALMTGGMATIAGGVFAVYAGLGANAGHLLTASVMSAPAALMVAKIMVPETETSTTAATVRLPFTRTTTNSLDALCRGAAEGLTLSLNVLAMLIAFVAVVALANFLILMLGRPFDVEITLQQIVGTLNYPFAWLMGIAHQDCFRVGQMLGERIVLNEMFGYLSLVDQRELLSERSATLATYALCGFANFGSVAIQIGGIGSLAPERRADLARLGGRALIAGLLACYTTTAVIGIVL